MSSGSRGGPPIGRYGSESDYGKRRKNYYAASTRRDFKSSPSSSVSTQGSHPGTFPSLHPNTAQRADKHIPDPSSRTWYRDVPGSSPNLLSSSIRPSYSKDARYSNSGGSHSKPSHPSFQPSHYSDRNLAYGSFAKKESDTYVSYPSSRESKTRDIANGLSHRSEAPQFNRDSWRSERPKLNSSASSKTFNSSSRFNPNNIPVNSRGGLSGLLSSVSGDHSADRYDSYTDDRWKPSHASRQDKSERPSSFTSRYSLKDRGKSSALTNSVGGFLKEDSNYSKSYNGRVVDRYSRDSAEMTDKDSDSNIHQQSDSPLPDANMSIDRSRDEDSDHECDYSYDETQKYRDDTLNYGRASGKFRDGKEGEALGRNYRDGDHGAENEEDDERDDKHNNDNAMAETDDKGDDEDRFEKGIHRNKEAEKASTLYGLKHNAVNDAPSREQSMRTSDIVHKPPLLTVLDNQHVDYPNGCIYPMLKLEAELLVLEKESKNSKHNKAATSVTNEKLIGVDVSEYPSIKENLLNFLLTSSQRVSLIKERNLAHKKKSLSLWLDYDKQKAFNDSKRKDLEEQLRVIHPSDDESKKELAAIDIRVKQPGSALATQAPAVEKPPPASRRGRRHGDLVTTEAEFQEILKSLENEQDEDPMIKARRVSAQIPDLILDPVQAVGSNFMDSNNYVHDKESWALRIRYDFIDNYSEEEHELFCEAFCRSPKRFGEISRYMGGFRSAEECVAHYYMTKKAMSYKFLVSQFKKKTSRKASRRKSSKSKVATTPTANEQQNILKAENTEVAAPDEQESPITEKQVFAKRPIDEVTPFVGDKIEESAKKKARAEAEETNSLAVSRTPEEPPQTSFTESHVTHEPEPHSVLDDRHTSDRIPSDPVDTEAIPFHSTLGLQSEPPEVPDQKRQNSSYWSITDVNEFPHLLSTYGSKWSNIASHFPTKTATMVRNYFQRNSEKNGWDKLVAEADMRLAHDPTIGLGDFNSVDSTIVVRPQKKHATTEQSESGIQPRGPVSGRYEQQAEYPQEASMAVLHESTHSNGGSGALSSTEKHTEHLESHQAKQDHEDGQSKNVPSRSEGQKLSIMNLLNSDSTPVKPVHSGPALVSRKPNNLSALLNAQSSPPTPVREAHIPDRRNSVKSLLQD